MIVVDERAPDAVLARAAALLDSGSGVVLVAGICSVRATPDRLFFEVPDPQSDQHRCEEETAVLIENARRALAASRFAARMPHRHQVWRVVASPFPP